MTKSKEEIIAEMQLVVEQMRLDDIEENPDSETEMFTCSACAKDACLAGSIQYSTHRLCNDCVLLYELALKLGKVQNIDEYMEKTEDNRLQNVCDFIKQESLKENN
jgi:hypothetical protein